MVRKRTLAITLLLMALAMMVFSAHGAPKKFTLMFNHVLSPKEPYHEGFEKWAERVNERTSGGLEIKVFHSAQLGVEEDIIEQIRQGANIGQNTDSARMGNYVPAIAVMNGPYFANTIEEVMKLKYCPTMQKWDQILADQFGLKILSFYWVQGYRHFMTNKPVRTPADLKGLRIRTPPAPIWQESVRALGAVPTALNFGEIYPGLQQKAVDGAELVYPNIFGANLNEVLKYVNETKHFLLINFEVVSSKWFSSLPAEYQKILVEECDKAGLETSYAMERQTAEYRKEAKARGMTIIQDVDMEAFKKAGQTAYEVLKIAADKEQIYKELAAFTLD